MQRPTNPVTDKPTSVKWQRQERTTAPRVTDPILDDPYWPLWLAITVALWLGVIWACFTVVD